MALPALKNLHPPDHVAARDAIDDRHSADDLPEDGVTAVQMWLRRMRDEKLAAAGVLARKSHPDRAANVRPAVYLAADLMSGTAFAVAARVTSLNDEIRNDAVKSEAVEEALARERNEAVHRDRRVLREEFDPDLALVGVNYRCDFFVQAGGDAPVEEFVMAGLNNADAVGEIARAYLFKEINRVAADEVILVGKRRFYRFDRFGLFVLRESREDGKSGVGCRIVFALR